MNQYCIRLARQHGLINGADAILYDPIDRYSFTRPDPQDLFATDHFQRHHFFYPVIETDHIGRSQIKKLLDRQRGLRSRIGFKCLAQVNETDNKQRCLEKLVTACFRHQCRQKYHQH